MPFCLFLGLLFLLLWVAAAARGGSVATPGQQRLYGEPCCGGGVVPMSGRESRPRVPSSMTTGPRACAGRWQLVQWFSCSAPPPPPPFQPEPSGDVPMGCIGLENNAASVTFRTARVVWILGGPFLRLSQRAPGAAVVVDVTCLRSTGSEELLLKRAVLLCFPLPFRHAALIHQQHSFPWSSTSPQEHSIGCTCYSPSPPTPPPSLSLLSQRRKPSSARRCRRKHTVRYLGGLIVMPRGRSCCYSIDDGCR